MQVINDSGTQVVDTWAFNANDLKVFLLQRPFSGQTASLFLIKFILLQLPAENGVCASRR
jgi:hypothetical protein